VVRRWIVAVVVGCLGLSGAACTDGSGSPTPGTTPVASGDPVASGGPVAGSATEAAAESTVRTDREPIAKRFPGLGAFTAVRWLGGTVGDDRIPGPSRYFVEAVVTLAPDDVARLAAGADLAPIADPEPPEPLRSFVFGVSGSGGWTGSEQLDAGFAPPAWSAEVALQLDEGVAYLSATGE
jgi:hypothetical protein